MKVRPPNTAHMLTYHQLHLRKEAAMLSQNSYSLDRNSHYVKQIQAKIPYLKWVWLTPPSLTC